MKYIKNKIKGSFHIQLEKRGDSRGFFSRVFCKSEFNKMRITSKIDQVNLSFSRDKGTVRGMHYQLKPSDEMKLVMCTKGAIFDVIIDLRKKSSSYKKWFGVRLDSKKKNMLLVPEGCAHGFQTLDSNSEVMYLVSKSYNPKLERGLRWNDKKFKIKWPLRVSELSEKDKNWEDFKE